MITSRKRRNTNIKMELWLSWFKAPDLKSGEF